MLESGAPSCLFTQPTPEPDSGCWRWQQPLASPPSAGLSTMSFVSAVPCHVPRRGRPAYCRMQIYTIFVYYRIHPVCPFPGGFVRQPPFLLAAGDTFLKISSKVMSFNARFVPMFFSALDVARLKDVFCHYVFWELPYFCRLGLSPSLPGNAEHLFGIPRERNQPSDLF